MTNSWPVAGSDPSRNSSSLPSPFHGMQSPPRLLERPPLTIATGRAPPPPRPCAAAAVQVRVGIPRVAFFQGDAGRNRSPGPAFWRGTLGIGGTRLVPGLAPVGRCSCRKRGRQSRRLVNVAAISKMARRHRDSVVAQGVYGYAGAGEAHRRRFSRLRRGSGLSMYSLHVIILEQGSVIAPQLARCGSCDYEGSGIRSTKGSSAQRGAAYKRMVNGPSLAL